MLESNGREIDLNDFAVHELSQQEQLELLSQLSKSWDIYRNSQSLLFYGGSFNPLHDGHRECIRQGLNIKDKKLIIMPDNNPSKLSDKINPLVLFKSLVNEFGVDKVYPGFLSKNEPNPTYEWLAQISGEKNLLLGDDSFTNLHLWKNYEGLVEVLNHLYIVPRKGDKTELIRRTNELQKINPLIKIDFLDHHDFEDLSSSNLRNTKS